MKLKPLLSLTAGAVLFASASGAYAAVAAPGDPSLNNTHAGDTLLSLTLEELSSAKQPYFLLTVTGPAMSLNFSFDISGTTYDGTFGTFKTTAYFAPDGTLIADGAPVTAGSLKTANNEVRIKGKLVESPEGKVPTQTLWTADLTEVDTGTSGAIGFGTDNFGGWADQYSSGFPESVWFVGMTGGDPDETKLAALTAMFASGSLSAFSSGDIGYIATVPVPAALWLFGSVLPAVVMIRRRAA